LNIVEKERVKTKLKLFKVAWTLKWYQRKHVLYGGLLMSNSIKNPSWVCRSQTTIMENSLG